MCLALKGFWHYGEGVPYLSIVVWICHLGSGNVALKTLVIFGEVQASLCELQLFWHRDAVLRKC